MIKLNKLRYFDVSIRYSKASWGVLGCPGVSRDNKTDRRYLGSVRGSPNGTIGNFTNGTNTTIGRANGTIGITIGANGITNGTIVITLNHIGIPLVPLVEP